MDPVPRGGIDVGERRNQREAGKDEAAHRHDGGEYVGPAEQEQGRIHGAFLWLMSADLSMLPDGQPAPK